MKLVTLLLLITSTCACYAQAHDTDTFKDFLRDKSTIAQFTMVGSTFAADGYTTQAIFGWPSYARRSHWDVNPFLSNFHSRPATVAYFGGSFTAYAGASYLLRRHKIIRWIVTGTIVGSEAYALRSNYKWLHYASSQQQLCWANPGAIACPR
jgi:hypothetical protein